jgi:hypothetical protein
VEWWGADVPVGEVVGSSAVYITGDSCDQTTGSNIATVAYSLSDGHQLWAARYDDPIAKVAVAGGIAVSPDGSTVYVTGVTGVGFDGTTNTADYVTIAYDANTGSRLWQATYDDPDHGFDMATQVAVSPDGARVYVTGASGYWGTTFNPDFATVSYVAATGQQDWVVLYDDPSQSYDWATGIAVVGDNVYVSGNDYSAGNTNYLVAAFRDDRALHTGQLLWGTEYDSGSTDDAPAFGQLEATPTGVYMTGTSSVPVAVPGCRKPAAYDTVAFNPVTGKRLWTATYAGPCYNQAFGLVVSSKSNLVYVTGVDSVNDDGSPLNQDAVTIAYDGTTGTQRWLAEYKLPAKAGAGFAIALSPDGSELFVGGEANSAVQDKQFQTQASALTIAYDAASGSQRWAAQSDDSATAGLFEEDVAYLLAVSLDGRMVLPVGTFHQVTPSPPSTASNTNAYDYGTLAYPSAG